MSNTNPEPDIDFAQISTRNTHARHIVVGCASALPALAAMWQELDDALADTVALAAHVSRLSAERDRARLERANLRAAMQRYARRARRRRARPDVVPPGRAERRPAARSGLAEASVSSYRKMRRQARLARRSGLQPMMVINAGEPFPETLGVLLARWAWRYRSELAPLGVAAGLMAAAWWLHHTRPHWWVPIAVLTGVTAPAVALFGARWRFPALTERVYAAITIYTAGAWLSAATAAGPFLPPLRQALIIGALILSIPWWSHRRRRAKVRLERKLQAWPDIAKAIGLAGAEVMSATVDVWGWRARFRLARGQTHQGRDCEDSRNRVRARDIPGRGTGLPDAG